MRSIFVMLFGGAIVFATVIATAQPPAGQRNPMNGNVPPGGGGQRGGPGGGGPGGQAGGAARGPGQGQGQGQGQQGPAGFGGQAGNAQMGQMTPMMMLGSLNLSNDQKQQVMELQREFEDRLAKILTPDQQKQLRDLQARGGGGGAGLPGMGNGQGPGGAGAGGQGPGGGGSKGGQGKRPGGQPAGQK